MTTAAGRRVAVLAGLGAATLVGLVLAVAVGSVAVPISEVLRVLVGAEPTDPRWEVVVGTVRLPRAITAVVAGAALGVAGLQMQTLFRNPLADPFILGAGSGASLGVALVIAGTGRPGTFVAGAAGAGRVGVVLAAAAGAAVVLGAVLALSRWVRAPVTLLIIGVMVGAATGAVVSLLLAWTSPERAQQYLLWSLGSFAGTTWADLTVLVPAVLLALLAAAASVKSLNALLLGEDYARTMGLRVRRAQTLTLLSAALLGGAVTAFCGPIAFLGIAVPHLARIAVGTSDHRVLLPTSALMGAAVALACSLATQLPGAGAVLPLNVVTALVGAPVVVAVLLRSRRMAGAAL